MFARQAVVAMCSILNDADWLIVTMSGGRKVATYSRRNPIVTVRKPAQDDEKTPRGSLDDVPTSVIAAVLDEPKEDVLATISATIRALDIQPANVTIRSRKSEIRPRLSIVPTHREYDDLLECCRQSAEVPFGKWLSGMQRYARQSQMMTRV